MRAVGRARLTSEKQAVESVETEMEVSNEPAKKLATLLPNYEEHNTRKKAHEKEVKDLGEEIKGVMVENDIKEFSANGVKATCSISERTDFNTDLLLDIIKKEGMQGLIKTQEFVDMDALENAIYNEEIDASKLARAQVTKEVITLRVNKEKKSASKAI